MRKILSFLFLTVSLSFLTAAPVDLASAKRIALQFIQQKGLKSDVSFVDVTPEQYTGFYILNATDGHGFVIVSSDDRTYGVLGYSLKSTFQTDGIPDVVAYWLNGYEQQMRDVIASDAGFTKQTKSAQPNEEVEPLLTSTWNQTYPYNAWCPEESSLENPSLHGHVYAGCAAVAMASVMRYWQWPERGTGSYSYNMDMYDGWHYGTLSVNFEEEEYDWANMSNSLTSTSSATQIDAVAKLIYHCGVASNSCYNLTGTGETAAYFFTMEMDPALDGFNSCVEMALVRNFNYKPTLKALFRSDYSDSTWLDMMKKEIRASRPVIYQGLAYDGGGHGFVIDGFTDDYFHVNFGWGGTYDGNYLLNSLGPNPEYAFNEYQSGFFNLEPNREIVNVERQNLSTIRLWGGEGQIHIENAEGQMAVVYDLLGRNMMSTVITSQQQVLNMISHGLYIVKVGQETFKVLVR